MTRSAAPAKAPPLTEKLFQRQVLELAKILGWRVYHPFLSKWSEKGFPDLTMVRARDRRLLFAELKTDKGVVSPSQVEWLDLLGAVAFDRDAWQAALRNEHYLVPIPNTVPLPRIEVYVWRPRDWDAIGEALR